MSDLSSQQQLFLDLVYEDGLPYDLIEKSKEVKEKAGYAKTTNVYQILRPLKDEIIKRNYELMVMGSAQPINVLQEIVRTPTKPGADTAIKAANSLLDRSGFGKKETQEVEIKENKGVVILPAKKD